MGDTVAVSMPVHGPTLPFLPQAVRSLLNQTHRNIQVTVTADGLAVGQVRRRLPSDPRLRVVGQKPAGRYAADAAVLADTDADWFCVHDADDWSDPDRLATLLEHAEGVEAVLGGYRRHRLDGTVATRNPTPAGAGRRLGHVTQQCCVLWDVAALRRIGGPNPTWTFGWDTLQVGVTVRRLTWTSVDDHGYHHRLRAGSLSVKSETGMGTRPRRQIIAARDKIWRQVQRVPDGRLAGWLLAQGPP